MANHIVLVPQKLLKNPPSVREGLSHAVEQQQRIYGCHLIQKAGVLLKLEAVSIASAQTILHRFFFRRSLKQFDVRRVATASLLLACKLEEDPRRVMHLIGVIWLLSQLEDQPKVELKEETLDNFIIDFDSQEYELFRMDVFRCERYILRELGFMVSQTLVHPHRYILQYIHALFKDNFLFTNQLSQKAWGYLNDSMRTTLCCEVQPAVIAVGSIFLAACDLGIPLPRETGWYELFDVSWEDVMKVCSTIMSLYTLPPPSYLKLADETKLVQKAPTSNSSGALSTVRSAPAGSSVSSRSRTTQAKEELAKPVAAADSSTNRSESLNSRDNCKVPSSSSSSSSRVQLTNRSSFPGKGDSACGRENRPAGAAASGYIEKGSPISTGMAAGDDSRETPQANQPGLQAEGMDYATAAAGEKRSGRDEVPGRSAARISRAQPRAPPPLKERSHTSVRSSHEVQATTSGRAVSVSPSPGSSLPSSCRGDVGGNSSSSRSTTSSSSSGTGSGSSSSGTNGNSNGGDGPGPADTVSAGRLKYIHFSSSRATPSADRTGRAGYSGAAGRRGSPFRKGGRDSEQSARRNRSPSAPPSNGRSFDREEWTRERQSRFELPRHGNSVGTQAVPSLTTAGNSTSDKEVSEARKDENSHSRSSHWSGSITGNSGSRIGTGSTGRGRLQDGLLGARESEIAAARSEVLRKGSEHSMASHGAAAPGVLQTQNNIPPISRREKDDTGSHRVSSGGMLSPQHPDSSHSQRLPRTSRSGNTAAFLSSTFSANYFGATCASSSGDAEGGGGSSFHRERRQRSPAWSLRCAESLEDASAAACDGEKRSVKRQRRLPPHS